MGVGFLPALLFGVAGVLLGYDGTSISSALMLTMKSDLSLSDFQEEIAKGISNFAAAPAALLAGPLIDRCGRRSSLLAGVLCFLGGGVLLGAATDFAMVIAGRLFNGGGIGIILSAAPVAVAELVRPRWRGALVALLEVSFNVGLVLGYAAGLWFLNVPGESWRYIFLLTVPLAAAVAAAVSYMPESPRWLMLVGEDERARASLASLGHSAGEAEAVLADIRAELVASAKLRGDGEAQASWREVCCCVDPAAKRMITLLWAFEFMVKASGSEVLIYYVGDIFEAIGITSVSGELWGAMGACAARTLAVCAATVLLDRTGRRPMLCCSLGGMALGYGLLSAASAASLTWLSVVGVIGTMVADGAGLSCLAYVLLPELAPLRYRAKAAAVGIAINRIVAGVTACTFYSMEDAMGLTAVWIFYCTPCLLGLVYFYIYLPETRALRLEEVMDAATPRPLRPTFGAEMAAATPPPGWRRYAGPEGGYVRSCE